MLQHTGLMHVQCSTTAKWRGALLPHAAVVVLKSCCCQQTDGDQSSTLSFEQMFQAYKHQASSCHLPDSWSMMRDNCAGTAAARNSHVIRSGSDSLHASADTPVCFALAHAFNLR
jgi:hypothetical protein